jgi:hypothetical protein
MAEGGLLRMSLGELRLRVYRQLEPTAWPRQGLSPTNLLLAVLIVIAVAAAVLETEPTISRGRETMFGDFEIAIASIFLVEYSSVSGPRWKTRVSPPIASRGYAMR